MNKLNDSMKIEFEQKQPCVQEIKVSIPAEALQAQMTSIASEYAKYANVPGFRVGKAPAAIVKRKYNDKILEELNTNIQKIVLKRINEDLEEKMITMPALVGNEPVLKEDEDYKVVLSINTEPTFELPEYKGLDLPMEDVKVDDAEIDAEINKYREMFADYVTVEEEAKEGDMLKVTYTSDLEEIEDALDSYKRYVSAENSWIWLNEPEMMPGLIKACVGVKAGDEKKISIDFGDDFVEPLLNGKSAEYTFSIIEVQRRMPLNSDEELCEKLKIGSIAELKENLLARKKMELENQARMKQNQIALETIVEQVDMPDLPPEFLARDKQFEFRRIADELVKSEEDVATFKEKQDEHLKNAEDIAKKNLKIYFTCSKIADNEGITVSQSELDRNIEQISKAYGYKVKELTEQMMQTGAIDKLHMDILRSKVATFIIANAKQNNTATADESSADEAKETEEDSK